MSVKNMLRSVVKPIRRKENEMDCKVFLEVAKAAFGSWREFATEAQVGAIDNIMVNVEALEVSLGMRPAPSLKRYLTK